MRGCLVLAAVVALAGCDSSKTPTPEPAKSATETLPAPRASAPAVPPRPRMGFMGRFRGPAAMVFATTRELQLSTEQQTKLDAINQKFRMLPPDPMTELNAELTEGVKEGKIDKAKLDTRYAAIEKTTADRSDEEGKALEELHALLTPEQRKTLVGKLRSRQVRPSTPPAAVDAAEEKKRTQERAERQAEHTARQLGFDADQQKKLVTVFAKAQEERFDPNKHTKEREALYAAFESEKLDGKKQLDAFAAHKDARARAKQRADQVIAILAIAKPDQRAALATWVQQSGGHFGMGGPGGFGGPARRPGGFGRPMPMPMPQHPGGPQQPMPHQPGQPPMPPPAKGDPQR